MSILPAPTIPLSVNKQVMKIRAEAATFLWARTLAIIIQLVMIIPFWAVRQEETIPLVIAILMWVMNPASTVKTGTTTRRSVTPA